MITYITFMDTLLINQNLIIEEMEKNCYDINNKPNIYLTGAGEKIFNFIIIPIFTNTCLINIKNYFTITLQIEFKGVF